MPDPQNHKRPSAGNSCLITMPHYSNRQSNCIKQGWLFEQMVVIIRDPRNVGNMKSFKSAASCGFIPALIAAGKRVAYIQIILTPVHRPKTITGCKIAVGSTFSSPKH